MNKGKNAKKKSGIFSCLTRFSEFIYSKIPESLTARLLISKKKSKDGLFSKLLSKLKFSKRVSVPIKRYFAKSFDNSFILGHLKNLISKIPQIQVKCIGLFYFAFGLSSAIIELIKMYITENSEISSLLMCIGASIVGGILCGSQSSAYSAFYDSKILSGIFFRFLNIPKNNAYFNNDPIGKPSYFLLAGVGAGALSAFIPAGFILLLVPVLLALYAIFAFPESGAVALFFMLPFLSINKLVILCGLVTLSWLIKLIRGKRIFKFSMIDLTVLAFGVTILFGGIISVQPEESRKLSFMLLVMLAGYFAISNILRTATWIKKCKNAIIAAYSLSLLASAFRLVINLLPETKLGFLNNIFPDSLVAIMSINPIFIHMAVAILPMMMLRSVSTKAPSRITWSVITVLLSIYCLLLGRSRSGAFAVIIGLALLLMLLSRKSLAYIIPAVIIVPLVITIMPASVTETVKGIFSFNGTVASYRQTVNYTTDRIMLDSFFGGIGIGQGAFSKIYPLYTNDLSVQISHASSLYSQIIVSLGISALIIFLIFIAQLLRKYFTYIVSAESDDPELKNSVVSTFVGISSLLIMGLIEYIWMSPSVFLLFWLLAALFSASVKTAESERYEAPSDGPSIEIDCNTLKQFSKQKDDK